MAERKNSSAKRASYIWLEPFVPSALCLHISAGIALIVLTALVAYIPSICGEFVLDDNQLLTDNSFIRAPNGLYWFWCTTEPPDYWPVTNTTLWIEWRLWEMNPTGYHVTNLILHIVESLLIWVILRRLSIPGAFLAAMIFAVHPVNVESVAWISQRKNTMAMLFFLISIIWYLKAELKPALAQNRHYRIGAGCWYLLSLAAFVLSMLSKGSVAVLPVLLLGIVWWLRPLTRWDLVRSLPFFMVSAVLTAVNVWFQTHGQEVVIRNVGFAERLLGAGGVVWFYLYKAFLPVDLAFVYPQWHIKAGNLLWWLPLVAAIAVTAVLWWYRTSWSRPLLFAWGFFCVALLPVMGFTDVGFMKYSLVADHYQHIAIIGVIALAAAGWGIWRQHGKEKVYWMTTVVAITAVGTLTFLTWRQSGLYRDARTLYQSTVDKNPDCWIGHNNLGKTLFNSGRLHESIVHYKRALQLKPDYPDAYYNMGIALAKLGRLPEAIENFEQTLRIRPDYFKAHNNLGIALIQAGRPEEAIEHYQQALRIKSDYSMAHFNLGNVLLATGRTQEAIAHYEQALRITPDYFEAYNSLGNALAKMGRIPEAIAHYEQALRLKPDYPDAHNNLAVILVRTGQPEEAIKHYEQALRLNPDYTEAQNNLGITLSQMNRPREAIEHFLQVLRLQPNYPDAHYNIGNALVQIDRPGEAIEHYRQALRLKPDDPMVYITLGIALERMDRFQEAIENYQQALRLNPNFSNVYFNLALIYARLHQSTEAIVTAEKALKLAQSQGQAALANQIEDWLNSNRASIPDLPSASPSGDPSHAPP